MKNGDSMATKTMRTPPGALDERRSAVAAFERWQRQWPNLLRGEAWLHQERLKRTIAEHPAKTIS